MSSKRGILYGRKDPWSEKPQGGVYEKDKEGYLPDNKYAGDIENGKPHGYGTWTQMDGATYVGQFVNGRKEGIGTFTWSEKSPNGQNSYEGEWVNNRKHGKGKFTTVNGIDGGHVEEGNWVDNKMVIDEWIPEGGKDYTEEELEERVEYYEEKREKYSKMKDKDILN